MVVNFHDIKQDKIWKIIFDDIDKNDLIMALEIIQKPDWQYELSNEIKLNNIKKLEKKYWEWYYNNWWWISKFLKIIDSFEKNDIVKLINFTKGVYVELLWDFYWHRAYKNFLSFIIIWYPKYSLLYNKVIKNDIWIFNYIKDELYSLFFYYPNRWDKVGLDIDNLYWYSSSWNRDDLDNFWESSRYMYWIKFRENWIIKKK